MRCWEMEAMGGQKAAAWNPTTIATVQSFALKDPLRKRQKAKAPRPRPEAIRGDPGGPRACPSLESIEGSAFEKPAVCPTAKSLVRLPRVRRLEHRVNDLPGIRARMKGETDD